MKKGAVLFLLIAAALAAQQTSQVPVGPPPAPVISDPSTLTQTIEQISTVWFNTISPYAMYLFIALAGLEFSLLGVHLWRTYNGDLRSAFFTVTMKVFYTAMFLTFLLNAGEWMGGIINDFIAIGKAAGGIPSLAPSVMLLQGFKIFGKLLTGATVKGLMLDVPTAHALVFGAIVVLACFVLMTIQFMVAKIQTFVVLGAGVLYLGFGGSSYTTNWVEKYFSFTISSGTRLMMTYLLVGAGWNMTNSWLAQADHMPWTQAGVQASYLIVTGAVLYAFVVWFLPSFVAGILSGTPNLSHSEMVAFVAPAIGAAVSSALIAAGIASGGATAAGGAAAGAGGGASSGGVSWRTLAVAAGAGHPPQTNPNGSHAGGGAAAAARGMGAIAQVGLNAAARMPHAGSGGQPPHFNGFGH